MFYAKCWTSALLQILPLPITHLKKYIISYLEALHGEKHTIGTHLCFVIQPLSHRYITKLDVAIQSCVGQTRSNDMFSAHLRY